MDKVFAAVGDFSDSRVGGGDSFCDRLNCRFTVYILILCAVMISTNHYVGEPISCWCPSHFTDAHVEYANKVCWVHNTYYLPMDDHIPKEGEAKSTIGYYQWVGLLLTVQAVLFYLPRPIWRLLSKKSGIAVTTITDAAISCQKKPDSEARDKTLRYMVKHMGRFLRDLNRKQKTVADCKSLWWCLYGNSLVLFYILMKIVYLLNVTGQLFLLNEFLGVNHDYLFYGFEVIKRLYHGKPISTSDRFPRVTFCNFKIRIPGNVNTYTLQCTLPVNLFNEKMYIFIWFWFVLVIIASTGSFFLWVHRCGSMAHQLDYIKTRLIAMGHLRHASDDLLHSFVKKHLRRDGMFIVWMVAKNTSDLIGAEFICGLFDHYKDDVYSLETQQDQTQEVELSSVASSKATEDTSLVFRPRRQSMSVESGPASKH